MNKARRKNLNEVITKLEKASSWLEDLMNEEEEYRDNMPENLQGSERYETADNAVNSLESAISSIEEAIDYINEAIGEKNVFSNNE